MKKINLLAVTALSAGICLPLGAHAANPVKLELGGFSNWYLGGATQDDSFENATGADYTNFDVQGDNEVHFTGSTKLDNGIEIAVTIELEGGGRTDSSPASTATTTAVAVPVAGNRNDVNVTSNSATTASTVTRRGVTTTTYATTTTSTGEFAAASSITAGGAADVIDQSYVTVTTGFGQFIIGTNDNVGALMHVSAPDVGLGLQDGDYAYWIVQPGNVVDFVTTYTDRDGSAEKLIYITPSFAGFSAGVSWTPDVVNEDAHLMSDMNANDGPGYAVSLGYSNTLGEVDVSASLAYYWQSSNAPTDDVSDLTGGLSLAYKNFTIGGSLRIGSEKTRGNEANLDGIAYDVAVAYAFEPYAVSLGYYRSEAEGNATGDDDEVSLVQLSGSYAFGPGIDLVTSIMHVNYDDERNANADNNEGWGVVTGMKMAF
ncbi:MAG: porin [Alphaproteobacteria bacterium]|nr:porin [Alphaproteobacteria bacterium]